jgi:hypothetical protein
MIAGRGRSPEWLEAQQLPARLVDRVGAVITVAGWPEDRRERAA